MVGLGGGERIHYSVFPRQVAENDNYYASGSEIS